MALIIFLKEAATVALQIRLVQKKRNVLTGKLVGKKSREAAFSKARSLALGAFSFRLTSF
jgi:hypothetical protein